MFCSHCGAENPDDAKFCSKCGNRLGAAATPTEDAVKSEAESSTGLSANVAGLLCYVLGWITGIVFLVLEKKSTFVKFHAYQSIMTFGILTVAQLVLGWIPFIGWVLNILIGILMFILWIILIIQAGTGKMWKVPWAGDWAEKQISR
ncbi:MAG: zinc-ribbon domain-containing protein [Chloroflexota bacterium]|nr:MAG: zinc-ribbon domain-containing protein [Chloroflexota bacterium]